MHFWIDKRSQTCGFGRARVAASLGGGGVGLGFGHPPRRIGSKLMVTPIHRLQSTNNTIRPHLHNNSNNSSTPTPTSSSSNSHGNRNNRNRANHTNGPIPHQPQQHQQSLDQQPHRQHQQFRHQNTTTLDHRNHLQRSPAQLASVRAALPNTYRGPSHAHDLEQGSLGIGTHPSRSNMAVAAGAYSALSRSRVFGSMPDASESQMFPTHLKCGIWASLVIASVFVAGAKFYFEHQGSGLEVLIFCAFSAIFVLTFCTVSLCRLPRDSPAPPPVNNSGNTPIIYNTLGHQHQLFAQSADRIGQELTLTHSAVTAAIAAPPPPYHVAILIPPESGKNIQSDEMPPPSYDKILI